MVCKDAPDGNIISKHEPLVSRRVILRPFSKDDLKFVQKWSNDTEIRKLTGEVAPIDDAEAERFFESLRVDKNRLWFAVILKSGNRVVGEVGLLRMFKPWRCTDMSVVIGEKDAWGKGYGTEAGRLLLDYAFEHLGFHRVSIGVVAFNKRALRFWRGLGFKKEVVQRDGYYCDDKFGDFVMMSILENEYKTLQKGDTRVHN